MVPAALHNGKVCAVVAVTKDGGMGRNDGKLPWAPHRLSFDMAFLQMVTIHGHSVGGDGGQLVLGTCRPEKKKENVVVMGRRTWESLPPKMRPLPGRRNIVLSSSGGGVEGVESCSALEECLAKAVNEGVDGCSASDQCLAEAVDGGRVYLLGGRDVYRAAIRLRLPFFLTRLVREPAAGVCADILFPMEELEGACYLKRNVTKQVYDYLLGQKPELTDKATLLGGEDVLEDGPFAYSFWYYWAQ